MMLLSSIASGRWLTAERLHGYPRLFLALYGVALAAMILLSSGKLDYADRPLGTDFISFYAAGSLALEGNAAAAYDLKQILVAEEAVIGSKFNGYYSFSYPPTFLLLLAPLAGLPYFLALIVWQGMSLGFYVAMICKIAGEQKAILLALAFPAVFITLTHGQNALLTTGLLCGGLHYLDRRPWLAGILIGLLTFKPHLGILIPIILILSWRWRVFLSAALTTLLISCLSLVIFGEHTWQAFLNSTSFVTQVLHEGLMPLYKMQSLFTSLRLNGASLPVAYGIHGALAVAVAVAVIFVWRQNCSPEIRNAGLVTGTLMMTPYIFDYDLTLLAIPIACLGAYGVRHRFRPWTISLLTLAWIAPMLVRPFNLAIPIPWTSILLLTIMYQIIKLSREERLGTIENVLHR